MKHADADIISYVRGRLQRIERRNMNVALAAIAGETGGQAREPMTSPVERTLYLLRRSPECSTESRAPGPLPDRRCSRVPRRSTVQAARAGALQPTDPHSGP